MRLLALADALSLPIGAEIDLDIRHEDGFPEPAIVAANLVNGALSYHARVDSPKKDAPGAILVANYPVGAFGHHVALDKPALGLVVTLKDEPLPQPAQLAIARDLLAGRLHKVLSLDPEIAAADPTPTAETTPAV